MKDQPTLFDSDFGTPKAADTRMRPRYTRSCGGCCALIVFLYRPSTAGVTSRREYYCPNCAAANESATAKWGAFQKWDRVKLKDGGFIWSEVETLVVLSASEDGTSIPVFRLGFPESRTNIKASSLQFKDTLFRQ